MDAVSVGHPVDDADAVRGLAADRLRELASTVLQARDGAEALRSRATAQPDRLVTDVGLPVLCVTGDAAIPLPVDAAVIGTPFGLDARALDARAMRVAAMRRGNGRASDARPEA